MDRDCRRARVKRETVSGSSSRTRIIIAVAYASRNTKMLCQPPKASSTEPITGASNGASSIMVLIVDITLAASRPL